MEHPSSTLVKKSFVRSAVIGFFCLAAGALAACGSSSNDTGTSETGESLYRSQCATCHGAQGQGDLGPNITGSTVAGIGSWTSAQFTTAVRTGVDDEGEPLCSGMTRFSTSVISDDQLTKIHDYLLTQINDTEHEPTGCP
jgi:mono/diheme cytochrome c family protein